MIDIDIALSFNWLLWLLENRKLLSFQHAQRMEFWRSLFNWSKTVCYVIKRLEIPISQMQVFGGNGSCQWIGMCVVVLWLDTPGHCLCAKSTRSFLSHLWKWGQRINSVMGRLLDSLRWAKNRGWSKIGRPLPFIHFSFQCMSTFLETTYHSSLNCKCRSNHTWKWWNRTWKIWWNYTIIQIIQTFIS